MLILNTRNVNDAWDQCKGVVNNKGQLMIARPSRVGDVLEYPTPVCTVYQRPLERVLFNPLRNCNPYFHFFEALWMLAGRNDIAFLTQFNPRMKEFSDDGKTQRGAYGYRWREWFVMEREETWSSDDTSEDTTDQLNRIVRMLRNNPDERRAVLAIWDATEDLERPDSKDVPCNLSVMFKIRNGQLTATISCRSNDNIWGTYGANPVQFSYLLEYMAARIGVPPGMMYQISDSWHVYKERWEEYGGLDSIRTVDYYQGEVKPYLMVTHPESFDAELRNWFVLVTGNNTMYDVYAAKLQNQFFLDVATPLFQSWNYYALSKIQPTMDAAKERAAACRATDWALAATQWLERIERKRKEKS